MEYTNTAERPIPTPTKMMRHSSQEQHKNELHQAQKQRTQYYQQQIPQYQQQPQHLQKNQKQDSNQYQAQEINQYRQQQDQFQQQQQQFQQFQSQQHQFQQQNQIQQHLQHQQFQQLHQQQYQMLPNQQQQQQLRSSSSRKDVDQQNFNMELPRKVPQSNKPIVKTVEKVSYPNISNAHYQVRIYSSTRFTTNDLFIINPFFFIQKADINEVHPKTPTVTVQMNPGQKQQETPSASSMQNLLGSPFWEANMQPGVINPTMNNSKIPADIVSTSMMSTDLNFFHQDNISAILGSEITDPGGSFELRKRLYGGIEIIRLKN